MSVTIAAGTVTHSCKINACPFGLEFAKLFKEYVDERKVEYAYFLIILRDEAHINIVKRHLRSITNLNLRLATDAAEFDRNV